MLDTQLTKKSLLTADQIRFYHENGYLVIENVFDTATCNSILKLFESKAEPDYRGIMNLDRENETVYQMVTHPKMVNYLETLQEAPVSLLQTMFLFKKAQTPYAAQAWNPHQDNAYPQAKVGAYITGNICFSDQNPKNGCMYIYPGSHRLGMLENVKMKSFHEKPGSTPGHKVDVPAEFLVKRTDLLMKKGSVLFLHGCVVHGSYANTTQDQDRPMLLIPYITSGVPFIPGEVAKREERPLPTSLFKS